MGSRISKYPTLEGIRLSPSDARSKSHYWTGRKDDGGNYLEPMRVYLDRDDREIAWRHFVFNKISGECIESLEMRFDLTGRLLRTKATEPARKYDPFYFKTSDVELQMKEFLANKKVWNWLRGELIASRRKN